MFIPAGVPSKRRERAQDAEHPTIRLPRHEGNPPLAVARGSHRLLNQPVAIEQAARDAGDPPRTRRSCSGRYSSGTVRNAHSHRCSDSEYLVPYWFHPPQNPCMEVPRAVPLGLAGNGLFVGVVAACRPAVLDGGVGLVAQHLQERPKTLLRHARVGFDRTQRAANAGS